MAQVATPQLLAHLKSLYPGGESEITNPWYIVAAVAFSTSNVPEAVPIVFTHALNDLVKHSIDSGVDARTLYEQKLLLVRRVKDAVFKAGMLSGFAKCINALASLSGIVPEELNDHETLREPSPRSEDLNAAGWEYFKSTYGETAESTQAFLRQLYPDLEYFTTTYGYGYNYGSMRVLSGVETSFVMVAANIAGDTTKQIGWHLRGAIRNGASVDQVKAVRQIAIDAAKAAGVVWKNTIPELEP